jgi:hypothetical protein
VKNVVLIILGSAVTAISVLCQTPQESKPKFEVASIKPSDPGQRGSRAQVQPGGRVVISGVPVRDMMALAYRVRDFQIIGGPGWLETMAGTLKRAQKPAALVRQRRRRTPIPRTRCPSGFSRCLKTDFN